MTAIYVLLGILGLALLIIVHESGHLVIARAFGMRVVRFSIGIGPVLWRHQPRGSETVYQIALVPFLAYVQISGLNPYEEIDPEDRSSYANASVVARISTIFAGPLANYLFASVLFFAAVMVAGGVLEPSLEVKVVPDRAAAAGGMRDGDRIVAIDGETLRDWDHMRDIVRDRPNAPIDLTVQRGEEILHLAITPRYDAEQGGGLIGVYSAREERIPMSLSEATIYAVVKPPVVVKATVVSLVELITGRQKPEFMGPVGIAQTTGRAAQSGWDTFFLWLGILSAYFGAFNLFPFPGLDGGRLVFLIYEAVTRRRPDARIEAHVHAVGLIVLLALIAVVTVSDFRRIVTGSPEPDAPASSASARPPASGATAPPSATARP
ncbi:MAG: site-2 protease family protein [Polyangiaceae bacterium]|nr:site-2 protease family protein [Polyangiaceae bacterium]